MSVVLTSAAPSRNPARILLALTLAVLAGLAAFGVRLPIGADEAVRRDIRQHAASQDLESRIAAALKTGDAERARSYADLAVFMGWRISPALQDQLKSARRLQSSFPRATTARDAMTAKYGAKAQAIVELTGKRSPAEFATSLSVFDFIVEHIVGFAAWLLALFGLDVGRRLVPRLRA